MNFTTLKRSAVSLFNVEKPETAISHRTRARTSAAKVGKGLSKDEKAQNLPYSTGLTLLIHAINSGTICISIMMPGSVVKVHKISFSGWMLEEKK